MKIVAISDLHGNLIKNIPNGDVLCICGDICPATNHDVDFQREWLKRNFIPWCENYIKNGIVGNILFCSGNHDWHFEELFQLGTEDEFRKNLPPNIHYLRDSLVVIDGVKFYGTPWQPVFYDWAFNRYEGELDKIFEKIPVGTDVLLSHGPPFGHNDMVIGRKEKLGSKALLQHLHRVKPKQCYFGHIHTGSHEPTVLLLDHDDLSKRTILNNVSLLDERYEIAYKPFVTEI